MFKAPEKLNEVLQGRFYRLRNRRSGEGPSRLHHRVSEPFNLVSEVLDTEPELDLIAVMEAALIYERLHMTLSIAHRLRCS
jgi:hypothetical protein